MGWLPRGGREGEGERLGANKKGEDEDDGKAADYY